MKHPLNLKSPCANCPFLKKGAIELRPGRIEEIMERIEDDTIIFPCHKTVRYDKANDDEESVVPFMDSSACAGAMIYLAKIGRPNIAMRLGARMGLISEADLMAQSDKVIDPPPRALRDLEGL